MFLAGSFTPHVFGGENHTDVGYSAIENRMFAPPVEFLRLLLAQNSTKKPFVSPFRFWKGAGGMVNNGQSNTSCVNIIFQYLRTFTGNLILMLL